VQSPRIWRLDTVLASNGAGHFDMALQQAPTLHRFERLDIDPVVTEDKETDSQFDDSRAKAEIWL
jgi:hypothetical protein